MKKIVSSTVVLLVSVIANAQIIKAELTATGLTCSMCSKATYKQLISISEVESVESDLNNTAYVLYFKKGSSIDISDIKEKVEDAGFSVGELIVVFHFSNQQVENNRSFTLDKSTYTFMDSQSATLSGEVKVKILDKGYIVEKEYKQFLKLAAKYPSYSTSGKGLYHVKVL